MQNDITYTDLDDRRQMLTESELQWFESVCNDCLAATGINVPIYCDNHYDKRKGKNRESTGTIHSKDPERPFCVGSDTYITIDTEFIHDCYMEKFNHVSCLRFEDLEHTIAHELAHMYQWRHCKRHILITEDLYREIKEHQEGVHNE